MKSLLTVAALFIAAIAGAQPANDKAAATKDLVESQNYVFRASTALPMHGRVRQLTDLWDLSITKSAVVSYLPYFGRAYQAPVDPTQNPMQFTAKDFEYTLKPHKKNGWDVLIKPKGPRMDVQQLSLNISSDGYATLQVIFNTRDAISYTGSIIPPPAR